MKACVKCTRELPISEFHRNPNTGDEHTGICRDCCAVYQKDYRQKNRDRIRADKKRYCEQNREKVLTAKRRYAAEHRKQESARAIQWQKDHPDRVRQRSKLRRFRERANGGQVNWQDWIDLCSQFNDLCAGCGSDKRPEMDHIVPVIHGGRGDLVNLQPLCRSCNASKHDQTIDYRPDSIKEWAERRHHESSEGRT